MEVDDIGLRSADNTESCHHFFGGKKKQFQLGVSLLAESQSPWGTGTCFWSLFSLYHTCNRKDIQVFDTLQPQPRKSSLQQGNTQGLTLLCYESASETHPDEINAFSLHHYSFFTFFRLKKEMLYWNSLTVRCTLKKNAAAMQTSYQKSFHCQKTPVLLWAWYFSQMNAFKKKKSV